MGMAILSAFSGIPAENDIAMTGEITLRVIYFLLEA
jgi:predicted ATP-dependent protease